jgi:malonate decarboxylase gamma subunit
MNWKQTIDRLFPSGHTVQSSENHFWGDGILSGKKIAILGIMDHVCIDSNLALKLAQHLLCIIRKEPQQPILLLIDTSGQKLSRTEEILGLNRMLAHLTMTIDLARRRGHPILSLVYEEAVSGGFLSFGMGTNETYALKEAEVRVMDLDAMARITKIPLETLKSLTRTSLIFAPGVENFFKLGGIHGIWKDDISKSLEHALKCSSNVDVRMKLGREREGRVLAEKVTKLVLDAPL